MFRSWTWLVATVPPTTSSAAAPSRHIGPSVGIGILVVGLATWSFVLARRWRR
jgi:hypothetical protein